MTEDSLLPFDLPAVRRKKVTAGFDGGLISSDGGVVLLREAERRLGLAETLAGCIREWRDPALVVHTLPAMLRLWTPPVMQAFLGTAWCMRSGAVVYPASSIAALQTPRARMEIRGSGGLSVAFAPGLSPAPMAAFPVPAHQTGRADFPHPAFGRDHAFAFERPMARGDRRARP